MKSAYYWNLPEIGVAGDVKPGAEVRPGSQKTLAANIPLWIISLDLSKAVDTAKLGSHMSSFDALSQHLVFFFFPAPF